MNYEFQTDAPGIRRPCGCPGRPPEMPPKPDCGENPPHGGMRMPSLAMVYSPRQRYEDLYDPAEGLMNGTIFRKLNKPFLAAGGRML